MGAVGAVVGSLGAVGSLGVVVSLGASWACVDKETNNEKEMEKAVIAIAFKIFICFL